VVGTLAGLQMIWLDENGQEVALVNPPRGTRRARCPADITSWRTGTTGDLAAGG
jgi:hypothetical protein